MKRGAFLKWINRICVLLLVVACLATAYIMAHRIGLIKGLDFGPGQYYYTDIPGWQARFFSRSYKAGAPTALYIGAFALWGFIMWKLWVWLDKRFK